MSLNNNLDYHLTRHNVGSWWIRYFCFLNKIHLFKSNDFLANYAYINFNNIDLFLLEPISYINLSGSVLKKFLFFNKVSYDTILIIHDDLDLRVGDIRLKFSGITANHKGIENINFFLNTSDFFRLRIGIGCSASSFKKDYVLSEASYSDKIKILHSIRCSLFLIDDILNLNFSNFRNKFVNFSYGDKNG